jgi:nucleoside permease NupC
MAAPNTITTSQLTYFGDDNPDGVSVGQSTSDKVSFYGVTPIVQRSSSNQAAVATTAITAPATTASISTAHYGYTSTQADAISAAVANLVTRVAANTTLVNELRAALVALGAIKGAA